MILGMFTDDYYPFVGGMGRYVYELSQRLPENRVTVFSPAANDFSNHVSVKPPHHSRLRNLSFSFWMSRHLRSMIETYALSGISIQCGPGGLFLLKSPGIPVIATCHHTWWQQSHYLMSQWWKRLFIPLERRTYQQADKIICDASDSRRILIERYGIAPEKITVIPIGVNREMFFPMETIEKIPDSLLFVGRPDKRKGIDFLLKAMTRIVLKNPRVKLYIGGKGKNRVRLRKYIKKNNLESHVIFTGFIPEDQLNFWYNRVQVVVVPSVFEGFGLTAVEAMAAGTPVIATDVDALREIIDDGTDGRLVPYGDTRSLSDTVVSLLDDTPLRKTFTENGLKKIGSVYDWATIIRAFKKEAGITD